MERDLFKLSASALETDRRCTRLWGINYVDKIRLPSGFAASLGTDVHTVAENWLSKAIAPPETRAGRIFIPGMVYLPTPNNDLLIEKYFRWQDDKILWRGFIDCLDLKTHTVIDHKTTGDFRYMNTVDELKETIQANLYAKWVSVNYGWEDIKAKWVYYKTKGRTQARQVEVDLPKEHINKKYTEYKTRGLQLYELCQSIDTALEIDVTEFPHNGCFKYGKCGFFEICEQKDKGIKMSDLLSKLNKMSDNGSDKAQPAEAIVNPPTTIVQAVAPKPEPVQEAIEVPKPKRGRPKKKAKAKSEITLPTTDANESNSYLLFVDCLPVSGAVNGLLHSTVTPVIRDNIPSHQG